MRTLVENGTLDGSYSYHSYARSKSRSLLPCPHLDRPPSLPHPCQGYLDSETTSTPPPLVATRSVKWDGRSGCGVVSLRFECRLGRAESFCGPLLYICEWLRSVVSLDAPLRPLSRYAPVTPDATRAGSLVTLLHMVNPTAFTPQSIAAKATAPSEGSRP